MTVLVKHELFAFKFGNPVMAYKYTNFTDPEQLLKTTLPTLPDIALLFFSVCNLGNKSIVLTGGLVSVRRENSAKNNIMDVSSGEWQEQSLPDLHIARYCHSSCCIGDQIFVACGEGDNREKLDSVEMLSPDAQAWVMIDLECDPSDSRVFAQIGPDLLCILGGLNKDGLKMSEGNILNFKTEEDNEI